MIRRLSWATVAAWLVLLALPVAVLAALTINWGTNQAIHDENGVILVNGDVVQLIWDQDLDGVDPPDSDGNPAGGDNPVPVQSSTIGTGSFFPGQFSANTPSDAGVYMGMRVYVRAWNANTLSSATYFGDSQIYVVDVVEGYTIRAIINYTDKPKPTPTAVELSYFTATSKGDDVLLAWETASELDVIGFNLHRGVSADGQWQKLNPQPIPAVAPGGLVGHAYTWVDTAAPRGRSYYYRLDEVLTDGSSKPVAVTSVFHGAGFRVWLPVTHR